MPCRDSECHKCHKRGHYSAQCFSKSVGEIHDPPESDDFAFLNTVGSDRGTFWTCTISVNGQNVPFKVDTGAEVTVISEKYAKLLSQDLQPPSKRLHGPDRQPLSVMGEITTAMTYKDKQVTQTIFVVRNLQHNLVGLPAIRALGILTRIEAISVPIKEQFPSLFTGLGTFHGSSYEIQLKPDSKPFALFTPRNVPLPLRDKVKDELDRMEALDVIAPVEEPTPWCAGMVVVPKKSNQVRICVDFRALNESVLREVHPLPKVDETLAQMAGATVFSKLDANCGFWQIPLSENCQKLTTFITPFGRYYFKRLPFGICSAPEYFQRRMSAILEGHDGVLCHMDDVFIFGRDHDEHDTRLRAALQSIQEAGVTLNPDKCEFSRGSITFLGHVIDANGISADPSKTQAVMDMERPKNITELRRFMGIANQLGKFSPKLAELSQPIRTLLSPQAAWLWGPAQEDAFNAIKSELATPTTLALYDPAIPTKISADASAYGLGAVLLQQHADMWKPVAFASRSMTETERRYSQIEKEALALIWASEKFADYVIGKDIELETDHKPLVPLLGKTNLDCLPPRVLRFRIRLMRFSYTIRHVAGKHLYTADTLSRAPIVAPDSTHVEEDRRTEFFVAEIVSLLPANADCLHKYRSAQQNDPTCSELIALCKSGWPRKDQLSGTILPYWSVRGELPLHNDLLLRGRCIVVPLSLRKETLDKIHSGHQGIHRCQSRVSMSVWWPGVKQQVEQLVQHCPACTKALAATRQPMLPTPLPEYPWQRVASDLFELDKKTYLLVADYFSRYVEVQTLTSTTSASIIRTLKSIFARHGIPETFVSDNGPQYSSQEMKDFARDYNFVHVTSSPYYPQSNGLAERMVQTLKSLIGKSSDPYLALLAYRSTPLPWCGLSPAQLLMGRSLRTDIPQLPATLTPEWTYLPDFREKDQREKQKQKANFDQRHRVRDLPDLSANEPVWVHTQNRTYPGRVITSANAPRSYVIGTPSGDVRRNQAHLTSRPEGISSDSHRTGVPSRVITRSQTGAHVGPPMRLSYWRRGDVVDS